MGPGTPSVSLPRGPDGSVVAPREMPMPSVSLPRGPDGSVIRPSDTGPVKVPGIGIPGGGKFYHNGGFRNMIGFGQSGSMFGQSRPRPQPAVERPVWNMFR